MALVVAGLLTACSGATPDDPGAVLARAKQTLDATTTVRFAVSSAGLPNSGAVLVSGDGVAKRPASFSGQFRVATGGVAMTLKVISVDGTLYAQVPFTSTYAATKPETLGVPDPATLLDPERGVSSLLTGATEVRSAGKSRSGREVVEEVTARLPGKVVRRLLAVADQSATFETRFFVADDKELRKATFRGPFYGKDTQTTYTVVLDRYDEPATITRPG